MEFITYLLMDIFYPGSSEKVDYPTYKKFSDSYQKNIEWPIIKTKIKIKIKYILHNGK